MLFKTYQKLLGASCLALYLVGCGSGGGTESPVEIEKNDFNSTLKIISKADNVEIQDLKLNRGNCWHNRNLLKELMQRTANAHQSVAEKEKAIKNHQAAIARLQKDLEELTQWVQSFNTLDKFWENFISAPLTDHDKIHGKFKLLSRVIGPIKVLSPIQFVGTKVIDPTLLTNPNFVVSRVLLGIGGKMILSLIQYLVLKSCLAIYPGKTISIL